MTTSWDENSALNLTTSHWFHYWVQRIWIVCPLVSRGFVSGLPNLIIPFIMFQEKNFNTADALSRSPVTESEEDDKALLEEIEAFCESIVEWLPATERLQTYRQAQEQDPVCTQLKVYCRQGWPVRTKVSQDVLHIGQSEVHSLRTTNCWCSIIALWYQSPYRRRHFRENTWGTPGDWTLSSQSSIFNLVARNE